MPVYCYETDDGQAIERVFPVGKAPARFVIPKTGRVARRSFFLEHKRGPSSSGWPMTCFASGVGASQAAELREHLRRAGVPTEVTPNGDPIYRDAAHRRRALRARGLIDRASFG